MASANQMARQVKASRSLASLKGAAIKMTGDKQLLKNIEKLRDSEVRAALKRGLGKAIRIVAKSVKASVPVRFKAAKQLVGTSFKSISGGGNKDGFTAKAGIGVGKAYSKIAKRKKAKPPPRTGIAGLFDRAKDIARQGLVKLKLAKKKRKSRLKLRRGVGMSGRNIHWWVLGTGPRTSQGGSRGMMPDFLGSAVPSGFRSSQASAAAAISESIAQELAKPRKT
jgi:hypothetical protein